MKQASKRWILISILGFFGLFIETPQIFHSPSGIPEAHAAISHEGTQTGTGTTTITVNNVGSGTDQLYLAAVTIYATGVTVSSISGGSLTWSLQKRQCSARITQSRVEVWQAFGSPASSFTVTVTLSGTATVASAAVSQYSGVDTTTPTEGAAGSNTNGQNGACSGGTDSTNLSLSLTSTVNGSMHYVATHPRHRALSSEDADYTQRAYISNSISGSGANLYVHDRTMSTAGTDSAVHAVSSAVDWDMAGLVIRPSEPLFAKIGTFTANSGTGSQAVSGVGFQPEAVLFWITNRTATGSGAPARFGRGWTDGTNQSAMAVALSDNLSVDYQISGIARSDSCIVLIDDNGDSATILARATITSLNSDGFTINWAVAGGSRIVAYLALGGPGLTNVNVGNVQRAMADGSGNFSITGVGFQPDVVLLMGKESWVGFGNPEANRTQFGFGVGISSTNRHTVGFRQRYQRGTYDNYGASGLTTDYVLAPADDDPASPELAYDLVSMDSDGFTLSYDIYPGDDRYKLIQYLALKGTQVARGTITQPTSTGNQSVTGLSFRPSVVLFDGGDKVGTTTPYVGPDAEYVTGAATVPAQRFGIWMGNGAVDQATTISDTDLSTSAVIRSLTAGTPTVNATADLYSMNSDGFTLNWTSVDSTQRNIGWIALGTAIYPTAVGLTSFSATEYDGGMLLEWKTGYEVNNLGFHIYREEGGQLYQLTSEPIKGSALMTGPGNITAGYSYTWWDTGSDQRSAVGGQRSSLRYWLEDIDLNGTKTMHGPVTPVFSHKPAPKKAQSMLLSQINKQNPGIRNQKSGVRNQESKIRSQGSGIRSQASGLNIQRSTVGGRRSFLSLKRSAPRVRPRRTLLKSRG